MAASTTSKEGSIHHVVQLDGAIDLPPLRFPHTFTKHTRTTPQELPSRISDATIILGALTKLSYDVLRNHGPKLQLIASLGTGVDWVDAKAVKERGITLTHTPAQNTEAVAEHALALYLGVKRRLGKLDGYVRRDEWVTKGSPVLEFEGCPRVASEETLGIIGYGALGKQVEKMAKGLGMTVLIAERKGESNIRNGRHSFDTVLKEATVLILTCPLDHTTHNMLSTPELALLQPTTILINVGRGGIVNESALAAALREKRIGGAGVDVFSTEPVDKENPLLDPGLENLLLTPHIAWFSNATIVGTKKCVRETLEAFAGGKPINVIIGEGKGLSREVIEGTATTGVVDGV